MQDSNWLDAWHSLRIALLLLLVATYSLYRWTNREREAQSPIKPAEIPSRSFVASEFKVSAPPIRGEPKRIQGVKRGSNRHTQTQKEAQSESGVVVQPLVFYSSLTGTTEGYAKQVVQSLSEKNTLPSRGQILEAQLHDLSYIEYDDYFLSVPKPSEDAPDTRYFYVILIPTYNIDTTLDNFLNHLKETHHDFRIDTGALSSLLGYSVFGFGDREGWPTEEQGFCSQAREVDKWMAKLTDRKRAYPLGMADVKGVFKEHLDDWQIGLKEVLVGLAEGNGLGEGIEGSGDPVESEDEDLDEMDRGNVRRAGKKIKKKLLQQTSLGDLEDLGVGSAPIPRQINGGSDTVLPVDFTTANPRKSKSAPVAVKAMVPVNSPTYAALTKQGYSIIGSHSGVKICRWTKSALRGRGSCYKRSFYGIASHLCMEATPSLSCSNKCVFCWRHGTNPVGTTWRWEVDPPEMILEGALEAHVKKIKIMKGVPGIRADRFAQAMRVRHCALSLVGEPIFYPRINEFLRLLHAKRISSFLVCNAQHPQQLQALGKVTQLYVSIDASNKESLRKVDRPLHRDFWERFQQCLDIIREHRFKQRTVFRLTLVKGFNLEDEVEGYADLVAKALPCFVEIKGVTYCGTSSSASAGLTMQNVPFWAEVQEFVVALDEALKRRGLDYGMAAEHAHSCCALLASTRFFKNGHWHTLIDYDRFFELLESGVEFGPEDYMGEPTPEWAGWGKGGFDPLDVRVDRKGRPIEAGANR